MVGVRPSVRGFSQSFNHAQLLSAVVNGIILRVHFVLPRHFRYRYKRMKTILFRRVCTCVEIL